MDKLNSYNPKRQKLECINNDSAKLLEDAVIAGNTAKVQELLNQDLQLDCTKGGEILWTAVLNNQLEIASMLVKAGADVNAINPNDLSGYSLLYELLKKSDDPSYHQLAVLIMEHGADVNYRSCDGSTPLEFVIREKCTTDIIKELLKHGAEMDSYHVVEAADHPNAAEVVDLLVGGFVDADKRSRRIDLALLYCVNIVPDEIKSLSAIKLLLNLNLPVDELSMAWYSLLQAIYRKRFETVKLLVEYGFDVNGSYGDPMTPLYAAASLQQSSITELLLQFGAEVNAVSVMYNVGIQDYPIHAACRYGSLGNIQILLRNGADVNVTDNEGQTPFSLILYPEKCKDEHRMMIKYIAILVCKEKMINDDDLKIIKSNSELNLYYNRCLEEIEKMRLMKIICNVPFFSIFEKNVKELSFLARNKCLLKNYDDVKQKHEFLVYEEEMDFVFCNAKKRKDLLSEKEKILCDLLKNCVPYVPLEKIIYYMYLNEME